jgi:hypothetical protein
LDAKEVEDLGKTKYEVEGYGQAGRLNESKKLQSLTQRIMIIRKPYTWQTNILQLADIVLLGRQSRFALESQFWAKQNSPARSSLKYAL